MPIVAAVIAPAISCPSAPMFQNFERKAKATAKPVKISGQAFTQVSSMLYLVPNAPLNSVIYDNLKSPPAKRIGIAARISVTIIAATGTIS